MQAGGGADRESIFLAGIVGVPWQDLATPESLDGRAYVDAQLGLGNPKLVAGCRPTERRMLRFVGRDTPQSGAVTFMACSGAPLRKAP